MTRLVLIIIFFMISLLSVFKAPMYYLWLLAIGVTEYPLVFAAIVAALLIMGFWIHKYQLAGTIIGVVALVLFLSPIVRAYVLAGSLQKQIDASLHVNSLGKTDKPFSVVKMLSSVPKVAYTSITYVNYPDIQLNLDFYQAQVGGKRPCVVVIHGGSWSSGDSKQVPELNSYLAQSGYNVAAINYRMAPQYQSPFPVEDVRNAMNYLKAHANNLHIDTNNFVLLGRSAGAQIALVAAYTLKDSGIKGVIDFYGPADMVWGYSVPASPLVMDSRGVMERYLGGTYNNAQKSYFDSSPLEFVNRTSTPTLIIHGENDVLVAYEHSRRLDLKLEQYGVKHYWLKLPWATHGFDFNLTGPGGQLSTYAVTRFLDSVSPPTP
ncbi:alpha/beta hydrolase fold domain-containing protein [Mucilaginibacter calamicampi]|uniref:Alpha/beta hydrolase fold domain-containing protein n=1 Tax=Mucilaginibacter calamicampi TaxID=1302352 RepID=A0ABW2Z0K6_9SPHI